MDPTERRRIKNGTFQIGLLSLRGYGASPRGKDALPDALGQFRRVLWKRLKKPQRVSIARRGGRGGPGDESPGPRPTAEAGSVPGEAGSDCVHPEGGRAAEAVLNAIYEADFLGFSYGFRPGRSPHQALEALTVGIMTKKVNWVLDADIRAFFDTLDHGWLVKFIEHRVADRRVARLIQKWLSAGVLEDVKRTRSEVGTVQGGSVSPLLANVYLHHVFDLWVQRWRKKRAQGDVVALRGVHVSTRTIRCPPGCRRSHAVIAPSRTPLRVSSIPAFVEVVG